MRTQHACRYFRSDPLPDDVLYRAIEMARFAPNGGNRNAVRFVIVRDPALKRELGALYLPRWREVADAARAGEMMVSSTGQRKSTQLGFSDPAKAMTDGDHFAEHFGEHPAIIVVCVDISETHPTDTELDRLSIVGGASVYPMAQNLCLALRWAGVATSFTTLLVASEPAVKELLGHPRAVLHRVPHRGRVSRPDPSPPGCAAPTSPTSPSSSASAGRSPRRPTPRASSEETGHGESRRTGRRGHRSGQRHRPGTGPPLRAGRHEGRAGRCRARAAASARSTELARRRRAGDRRADRRVGRRSGARRSPRRRSTSSVPCTCSATTPASRAAPTSPTSGCRPGNGFSASTCGVSCTAVACSFR